MTLHPDVVVIGAGPAGIAAAIQLRRYGIPTIVLEKERIGGLLWNANLVENYPGFPNGVSGVKLVSLFEKQMQRIHVDVLQAEVECLDIKDHTLVIGTYAQVYQPRFVVVASGTQPKPLPLEIPQAARSRVFCEVYPLLNVRGKRMIIVGAGDAAFDYALNLSRHNTVTILNRDKMTQCLPLLYERVNAHANISYRDGVSVSEVKASVGRIKLRVTGEERGSESLQADYLVFAIGRQPQTDFISARIMERQNDLSEKVFFVGDVKNGLMRQTAIAAGNGVKAAMQIYNSWRN